VSSPVQVQEQAISSDGTPVAFWRSGHGRPLVLVHGTSADHTRWQPVLGLLEADATVYAMDRRGRGHSGDADGYSIEREFDDVVAVVDAVAEQTGEPIDVFGHSYGAVCSLEAARLTTNIRTLVLYEPPAEPVPVPAGLLDRLGALLVAGRRDEVLETFFREVVGMPDDQLSAFRALPAWRARVAAAHTVVRELAATAEIHFDPSRFASLAVPTLLLSGSDSPEFLRSSSATVAAALPNARVVVLEGQQHVAIDTAPQLLTDAVKAFLAHP
jgi:pimeloyl-ACP methyl ester carboxylesterase